MSAARNIENMSTNGDTSMNEARIVGWLTSSAAVLLAVVAVNVEAAKSAAAQSAIRIDAATKSFEHEAARSIALTRRGMNDTSAQPQERQSSELSWPAATRECRPWTRWWWLGSAVDKANLTRLLTQYQEAGLGGVEICPIYGAKGYEDRFIDFLSSKWMEMLAHTTTEAKRLNLGVDLTTGTGWPFGGPRVSPEDASAKVILKRYDLAGGDKLKSKLPEGQLQCLMAVSDKGRQINLTDKVDGGLLDWTAPPGQWRLYAVVQNGPVQKVKRAAPGGEGSVLNPYSVAALNKYLADFDRAFADYRGQMPRSHFHDSFEYYGASWTSDFFREFESRRGYDLRAQLPALFGDGPEETVSRVKGDYRETISDMHLAYIQRWTEWCHAHGSISRNQAHGAPGNLMDIYAAADIPETEIFGDVDEKHIPLLKFASSAAHLTGRKLSSSESFTWLGEHFQVSLSQVKQAADYLFIAGVNHIFFHGIPYSPADAPWPGWQFYAAVNFGPQGGLWHDLPQFNAYVTRCQSILQAGSPANDILLYLPLHDFWHAPGNLIMPSPLPKPFFNAAMTLWERGYAFDEVSDRLLAEAKCANSRVVLGGNAYRVVLVPKCRLMPEATLRKLIQLAREGATILMQESLPADVPGLGHLEKRHAELREMLNDIKLANIANTEIQQAALGNGVFLVGTNLEAMLRKAGVSREPSVDLGIRFVRRTHPQGCHYFLANRGKSLVDGWVALGSPAKSAVILDPRFENRAGVAALRRSEDGSTQVYLQLQPGESCILRTFAEKTVDGPSWRYFQPADAPKTIAGTWKVQFVEGGPELPAGFETRELASWTTLGDAEAKRFAGTARYTIEFDRPAGDAEDWLLDLGQVCESARVKLNGRAVGALWCRPFQMPVGEFLLPGKNTLEVEVTNLAANRIADLDRRKVNWKYFYDINVASRRYKSLDASDWPLQDSGLVGPVHLQAVKRLAIQQP